jgi:hypothetical protein
MNEIVIQLNINKWVNYLKSVRLHVIMREWKKVKHCFLCCDICKRSFMSLSAFHGAPGELITIFNKENE